jgi:hypothetical protein
MDKLFFGEMEKDDSNIDITYVNTKYIIRPLYKCVFCGTFFRTNDVFYIYICKKCNNEDIFNQKTI